MTSRSGPTQSIEQRKQSCATSRRILLYVAAAGGVLMIPMALAVVPAFIDGFDGLDVFEDHFGLCGALSMIGATLLGGGLSWASHCRKQYAELEREEAASRNAGQAGEDGSASSDH